ncbi:MAG TPA: hypothetical protein VK978_02375 [Candidatus Saccharimonadales bacterium]|nr:hypothetical protein [Candidatus Saccharimonadales bacterium]
MTETWYEAMLLMPAKELPAGPGWSYEPKLDGYRVLGRISTGRAVVRSRHGTDFTGRFPEASAGLLHAFNGHTAFIDGEIVGHDHSTGQPSFSALQRKHSRAVLYIFDLLELDGDVLVQNPLQERRAALSEVIQPGPHVNSVAWFEDCDQTVQACQTFGLEGVIAKRTSSPYRQGRRHADWQKMRFPDYPTGFGR